MILRPRLIVQATTFVLVCFMGLSLWLGTIWSNYESFAVASNRDRGNGVKPGLDVEGIGTLPSTSGRQERPSLPGNPVPLTSGKGGANPPAPGFERESPCKSPCTSPLGVSVALSRGVRSVRSSSPEIHERVWRGVASAQGFTRDKLEGPDQPLNAGRALGVTAGETATTRSETCGTGPQFCRTWLEGRIAPPQPNRAAKAASGLTLGRDRELRQMATDAAGLCGVPARLFHSLIERESSWRPYVVSSSGAVGLAQVKPSTARDVSPGLDVHDPWQNLVAGSCYLRQQYDRFGTWRKALHAYVAGPNRVRTTQQHRDYASDILEGSAQ